MPYCIYKQQSSRNYTVRRSYINRSCRSCCELASSWYSLTIKIELGHHRMLHARDGLRCCATDGQYTQGTQSSTMSMDTVVHLTCARAATLLHGRARGCGESSSQGCESIYEKTLRVQGEACIEDCESYPHEKVQDGRELREFVHKTHQSSEVIKHEQILEYHVNINIKVYVEVHTM